MEADKDKLIDISAIKEKGGCPQTHLSFSLVTFLTFASEVGPYIRGITRLN
ncbi:uncharacterized protein G2W53_024307 [Senna tora]|uniref:Uncharacterized protein n=1 Tax=Senna tora TaxID=362788 RepID=A0A834TDB2_9FABA|nr:uncharacterized protein G2W53_024307 [Senna tora]